LSLSAQLAPSQFVVRPDIADPACNGGRGVRLRIPSWKETRDGETEAEVAKVSTATIADGSTLIAFVGYGRDKFAVLHSLTPECTLDRGFGTHGTATLALPSSLRPAHPPPGGREGLSFYLAGTSNGGGAFLAGRYEGHALVAEVTAGGTLDSSFGEDGWVLLPFAGTANTIVQEPSGQIIVDGEELTYAHFSEWMTALSPEGLLDGTFGGHGRVNFFADPVHAIEGLGLEPDGDILVADGGGRMGCYEKSLTLLSPSGEPVPRFDSRLARFWKALGFSTFLGDAVIRGDGFALVGTGQRQCLERPHATRPRRPGVIALFQPDGEQAGPTVRFPSKMFWGSSAFVEGHDIMVLTSRYGQEIDLGEHERSLIALEPDGSPDPRFASHGRAQITIPETEDDDQLSTHVSSSVAVPGEINLLATPELATPSKPPELQLIRLRL
jgi:hypothetical protein